MNTSPLADAVSLPDRGPIPEEVQAPTAPTDDDYEKFAEVIPSPGRLLFEGAKRLALYYACTAALKVNTHLAMHSPSVGMSDFFKDVETYLYFHGKTARDEVRVISAVLRETRGDGGDDV